MAYNKRTWATGNVVGAVDLNRMEGGIEENHPGYEYKEEIVTLWEGSITTTLSEGDSEAIYYLDDVYPQLINVDKLYVTFNGTRYECSKVTADSQYCYGGINSSEERDFSEIPFALISYQSGSEGVYNDFCTPEAGTYTVKLEANDMIISTTPAFQEAVKSVADSGYECTTSWTKAFSESGATTKTTETNTVAQYALGYADNIDADEIKINFNGTEYTCPKTVINNGAVYGSTDFSFTDYPFVLGFSESEGNLLLTKDPMDFDVTVFAPVMTATVTPCFETAVKTLIPPEYGSETISIPTNSFLQIKSFSVSGNTGYINISAKDINSTSITVPTGSVSQDLTVVSAAINGVSISSSSTAHLPIIIRSFEYHTDNRCGYVTIDLYNTSEEAITINSSEISIYGVVFYYDSNSITTICYRKGLENSTPVYE